MNLNVIKTGFRKYFRIWWIHIISYLIPFGIFILGLAFRRDFIIDFYIAGADAVACVKSTCYNLSKANYGVNVLSDCITSYDKRKINEKLHYYESKGSRIISLSNLL